MKNKENNKKGGILNNRPLLYTIIGLGAVMLILSVYIILSLVFGSMNPTKWRKNANSDAPSGESAIICAIFYPDLQESGEIWQTGGMQPTHAKTLREALESDFDDGFFTFAEDGTIASAGGLTATNGYTFKIQRNTTRSPELLPDKPADTELADSETYEITYCDPDGETVSILPEGLKEMSGTEPKNDVAHTKDPDNSEDPKKDQTEKPTENNNKNDETHSGSTNSTESGNNTETTVYTDPETNDNIANDIF